MAISTYDGDSPNRSQDQTNFNTNMARFVSFVTAMPAELNTFATQLVALANVTVYSGAATYDLPDTVIADDGITYRCIGTSVTGVEPGVTADWADDWVALLINADEIYPLLVMKNLIINALGRINQEEVSGTVALSAGEYGHDQWVAGASGCTYTFATSGNVTTFTISAGTLAQPIEDLNVQGGGYIATWNGTAQARIGSGSYGDSGLTATLTAGTQTSLEFGTGTFNSPQLEKSDTATSFEYVNIAEDLSRCQRYFNTSTFHIIANSYTASVYNGGTCVFPVIMRTAPSITSAWSYQQNCTSGSIDTITEKKFKTYLRSTGTTNLQVDGRVLWEADARLTL